MKICTLCKKEKDLDDFVRQSNKKDGRGCWCKECHREKSKQWRLKNIEKSRIMTKKWRENNPNWQREGSLRKNYGIDLTDYEKLLSNQGGVCAICGNVDNYPKRNYMCIDHVKDTLKIRGILCNRCNSAIGLLDHDIEKLKSAIKYLKKSPVMVGKKYQRGIHHE